MKVKFVRSGEGFLMVPVKRFRDSFGDEGEVMNMAASEIADERREERTRRGGTMRGFTCLTRAPSRSSLGCPSSHFDEVFREGLPRGHLHPSLTRVLVQNM
ncbi:MAG: hypothetical protein KIH01_06995 [Candidatus Freyarchaeota archaeon]|nr:hypothetical protein [Candidatus Jordarchaeia archaeon]